MAGIEKIISKNIDVPSRPVIFNFADERERAAFLELCDKGGIKHVADDYVEELREYFAVLNPALYARPDFEEKFTEYRGSLKARGPLSQNGRWVYFPWLYTAVHILEEKQFYTVRTARNRNLINAGEQDIFYNAVIGIAGLSVGQSIALSIVLEGGAKHIKLADNDRLALSNTNRVRAGIENLGLPKVEITARQIYEINPYANIEIFPDGLNKENLEGFVGAPRLDVLIDEIDNLAVKYLIREKAKKYGVPIVMAADNGDNGVVDVERYDEDPNLEFFHGRMGPVNYDELLKLDKMGTARMIAKHVGAENVAERMQQSLAEIGKTIVSWPQLGGAAILNGAAVAYCVRKIVNKQPLADNRALISLDEKLIPDYFSPQEIARRETLTENFRKMFGI